MCMWLPTTYVEIIVQFLLDKHVYMQHIPNMLVLSNFFILIYHNRVLL